MLSVSVSRRAGSDGHPKPWQARWREPDTGKQRKKSFTRKLDADRFAENLKAQAVKGSYVDPHDATTLTRYATDWVGNRPYRESSSARMRSHLTHITTSRLGGMRLQLVRPSHVQAFATEKARTLSPVTVRALMSLLRAILRSAVEDGLLAAVPVPTKLSLPKRERQRVVPLTVEQVRALAGKTPPIVHAMVVVQAALGLRMGELLGLRVADVDFLRREVNIRGQLHPRNRVRIPTKTERSVRAIPLPKVAADALAAHLAEFGPGPDGLLFKMATGLAWQGQGYAAIIARSATAAGLPPTTTHDLRHHFACVLLEAGESVVTVRDLMGHTSAALVLSTYGHRMPKQEDRTRRALDDAWSTSCAPGAPRAGDASL